MEFGIVIAIKNDVKRMAKLASLKSCTEKWRKAHNYVIGECRKQKVKTSHGNMVAMAALIVKYVDM